MSEEPAYVRGFAPFGVDDPLRDFMATYFDKEDDVTRGMVLDYIDRIVARAALTNTPAPRAPVGELDAAWAEAEAALPQGGRLHLQRRAEAEAIQTKSGRTWVARQGRAAGAYEAWATDNTRALGFAYDETPAAALHSLALRLREVASG